ncbi:G protein-activated inward rectifier potassium channel 3-like isoform X1 [Anopheles darlingi]|uniref:G protein-activated inward rectifier potassium channel 3-like isoform X1 n=1 Tax=Anopheles darlingi TaxID=43151 RepID=UPI002100319C|nr:G protein-activated inward rectifier potassium channel 3-like isoform X1 [Anopheles darlingi]
MSFGQRKNFTVPMDPESPEARDDAKLLPLTPFDKIPPILIGDGQDPPKTPITPTTPIVYCPQSPSVASKRSRALRPGTTRKYRRRAILKNGDCNIVLSKVSRQQWRFLQDIFTTLVDAQWRWTLLVFAFSFIFSWLFFGLVWWLIAFTNGDLEPNHLPSKQEESGWKPCVFNIESYTSAFLFSIETQTTIGYGYRTTTEQCPEAIFVMCFQSIYGVMMQAFMVGFVFAKMTRPKHRTQTLLFSKHAVICQRDGELCLMFRVGDMRKSHIIGANIRAQLIRTKLSREGEVMAQYQHELEVGADQCGSDLFFIWPQIVTHKINTESPFYNMSASDLLQDRFEVVVILEGTVESTGQSTQARSSYVNSEILWGHRFEPIVFYNKENQVYEINYSKFNETHAVDTPLCSARELAEFYKYQDDYRNQDPDVIGSSKSMFEKRWHRHYTNTIRTLSTVHLEDEQTPLTVQARYLTIHAAPRRPRSYLQLENNLRNLFDRPSITISPSSVTSIRTDSR